MFTCQVGVVPRLDCRVLIEGDCPIPATLLKKTHPNFIPARHRVAGGIFRGRIAHPKSRCGSTDLGGSPVALCDGLRSVTTSSPPHPPGHQEEPCYALDQGILYRWVRGYSQVVASSPLHQQDLYLAHNTHPFGPSQPREDLSMHYDSVLLARHTSPVTTLLFLMLGMPTAPGQGFEGSLPATNADCVCSL